LHSTHSCCLSISHTYSWPHKSARQFPGNGESLRQLTGSLATRTNVNPTDRCTRGSTGLLLAQCTVALLAPLVSLVPSPVQHDWTPWGLHFALGPLHSLYSILWGFALLLVGRASSGLSHSQTAERGRLELLHVLHSLHGPESKVPGGGMGSTPFPVSRHRFDQSLASGKAASLRPWFHLLSSLPHSSPKREAGRSLYTDEE
jgi:hypothetical protein